MWAALLGNSSVAELDAERAALKVVEMDDEMVVSKVAWMVDRSVGRLGHVLAGP